MSAPDDPYASPPREREAGSAPVPGNRPSPPPGPSGWGTPAGPPPPAGAGGLGTAALVVGVLALVLGVSIVGGVVLGALAISLGVQGRARAKGGPAGTAVAGIVLGALGLAAAGATYLYVRDDLAEYQGCRKESVSLAQDRACEQQLRHAIRGR